MKIKLGPRPGRLGPRPGDVYTVRDIGPYGLWTTIVVRPDHTFDRPLRGFNYSIGMGIPGLLKVTACRSDTNMNIAGCFIDESMVVETVSWRIPSIALGKYQQKNKDYTVRREDVTELVDNAHLIAQTKNGSIEIPLAFVEADAVGGHGASFNLRPNGFDLSRLENFWVELSFTGGPRLCGAVPIIITFDGQRMRGVQ